MSLDLCQVKTASKPFYIEHISTYIYSIEELCFFLHENVYLIDSTIINESLCEWIRDELDLKRLGRILSEQLEDGGDTVSFIMPIFREIGYLTPREQKEYQEKISKIEVAPKDMRAKLKGDYLVRSGMLPNAVTHYFELIKSRSPGSLGAQFYCEVWNNLGCALARMFKFREAMECSKKAWEMNMTRETLRRYICILPLCMDEASCRKTIDGLDVSRDLLDVIKDYNYQTLSQMSRAYEDEKKSESGEEPSERLLERCKDDYRRSARCTIG